jgi:hypothetical protein
MGLIDDLRRDLGDDDTVPVSLPPSSGIATLNGLLGLLRIDIGDDDNVGASLVVPSGTASASGLPGDLRLDVGDDDTPLVITTPASGSVSLDGMIRDLRVDIGDDRIFLDNTESPVIWGARIITTNVYNKQPDDVILFINTTIAGPTTVYLPSCPIVGQICVIKDAKGDAATNHITIQPPVGVKIDGFNRFLMTQNRQAFMITWNGTEFNII